MKNVAYLLVLSLIIFGVGESNASIQLNSLSLTKFVRGTGEPITSIKKFSGIAGPAKIKLVNGDLKDASIERVSSAIIDLNGVLVFGPSDFNQKVNYLEKDINLSDGNNSLGVLLKGKPGGSVSIQIIQILHSLKVNPAEIIFKSIGTTAQITLTGELSNGKVVNITKPSYGTTYSSTNINVATVSDTGLVTAISSGEANIVVKVSEYIASIPVKVEVTQSTRTVGPAGGTLEFHNGVIFNVPANAVTAETTITVKDLKCSDVDLIITSEINVFHPKRCLGAFSAEPIGLVFELPITATVPVLRLEPGEVPIHLTLDLDSQTYNRVPTDLIYYGDRGVADIKIVHFSGQTVTAEKHSPPDPPDDPCPALGLSTDECNAKIERDCTSCTPLNENIQFCQSFARPNDVCCMIPAPNGNSAARDYCWGVGNCYCCMEKRIHVVSSGIDFSAGECQILSDTVTVTFLDCPGSPTFSASANEASKACEDYHFTISIVPSTDTLAICAKKQLKARIVGTSPDGKKTMTSDTFMPDWESQYPDIVSIDPFGWVERLKEGDVQVKAYVKGKPDIDPGYATIGTSTSNPAIASITITPPSKTLFPGESVQLVATAKDASGSPIGCNYSSTLPWYSSNLNVAMVDAKGKVVALSEGRANITAVSGDVIGVATITVSPPSYGPTRVNHRAPNTPMEIPLSTLQKQMDFTIEGAGNYDDVTATTGALTFVTGELLVPTSLLLVQFGEAAFDGQEISICARTSEGTSIIGLAIPAQNSREFNFLMQYDLIYLSAGSLIYVTNQGCVSGTNMPVRITASSPGDATVSISIWSLERLLIDPGGTATLARIIDDRGGP
jgi:uncharacterized protein YjdB